MDFLSVKIDDIEEIVRPVAESMGLDLVDVELIRDGGYNYIRIYVENLESDTSIDDCVEVSRKVEESMDELIDDKFFLEVSSPGLERPLKKEKDFLRFKGQKIILKTNKKINDKKVFEGILNNFVDNKIFITENGEKLEFLLKEVKKVNLIFEFENFDDM